MKKVLVINRRAPHSTPHAQDALDLVLALAMQDQSSSLAFIDDGVLQLKSQQQVPILMGRNFSLTYRALAHYDIHQIYVAQTSLQQRGLTVADLLIPVTELNDTQLAELFEQYDIILNF